MVQHKYQQYMLILCIMWKLAVLKIPVLEPVDIGEEVAHFDTRIVVFFLVITAL